MTWTCIKQNPFLDTCIHTEIGFLFLFYFFYSFYSSNFLFIIIIIIIIVNIITYWAHHWWVCLKLDPTTKLLQGCTGHTAVREGKKKKKSSLPSWNTLVPLDCIPFSPPHWGWSAHALHACSCVFARAVSWIDVASHCYCSSWRPFFFFSFFFLFNYCTCFHLLCFYTQREKLLPFFFFSHF